jgi:two-component system, sensor histidine kinase and response regulator
MKIKIKESILENQRLVDIFRQSPISIELYDEAGFLLEVNQSCIDLFGLRNGNDIRGFNLFTNPHLSEKEFIEIKAGKSIRYEIAYDFEVIKSKNLYETTREGIIHLECFINPTLNQHKEITGYIVHITEITERKNAQELLARQTKELQELNATKDKFMSIIAHDLKSPFNAILGFSDLMLRNFDQLDPETFFTGLKTIESASTHAYKLLENLLIWSQNQTGKSQFNPKKLNLEAQVNDSIRIVESASINKKIKISTSIKKTLHVFADKNMLDSILRNLISNAIKFSFKGGKIKVTATQLETEIQISVSDKGIGISAERLSAIFEIDKHTNTTGTENELGTGLGLVLCKDFITQHNGKIWIESTPNIGTMVSISLPLK